jgi:uncharacterized membrane protein YhaH (DUF805 family)
MKSIPRLISTGLRLTKIGAKANLGFLALMALCLFGSSIAIWVFRVYDSMDMTGRASFLIVVPFATPFFTVFVLLCAGYELEKRRKK